MNQIETLGAPASKNLAISRRAALGKIAQFSAILPLLKFSASSKWGAPKPEFNFGDRVRYSFEDEEETITYEGNIQGMVYCPESLELVCQSGYGWFYAVHWQIMPENNLPQLLRQLDTSPLMPQSDLRRA